MSDWGSDVWSSDLATAEGITLDLEAMARVGVGGAQMFDVGCGIPAGPAGTQSPEWVRLVRHAVDESGRLGLSFTLHNCTGWSSSGGPWITPELSMQQLVLRVVPLNGGKRSEERSVGRESVSTGVSRGRMFSLKKKNI